MVAAFLNAIQELTPTQWISIAALLVSLTSLTVSTLGYLRDRPRLKVQAWLYCFDESLGHIEIKAVNVGRRPIYLVRLWGADSTGDASGMSFDHGGPGIKLNEHEFKTFRVTHIPRGADQFNASGMNEDDIFDFDRMWIEDSLGNRHNVPRMRMLLPGLRAHYKEWCERTGYWKTPSPPSVGGMSDAGA